MGRLQLIRHEALVCGRVVFSLSLHRLSSYPRLLLMTKFSEISSFVAFFWIPLTLSLSGVRGLHVSFERRAPRGVSMTSPRSPTRYRFASTTASETLDNKRDFRVMTSSIQ